MHKEELRSCALRVIPYKNRIAVEFFHSLTDGTGGLIFLKTLLAEYIQQKYGVYIPAKQGVLGRLDEPKAAELEDSFPKYAGPYGASRRESNAFRLSGTPEQDGFLNITCFTLSAQQALEKARSYGVSLTTFLAAAMLQTLQTLQTEQVPDIRQTYVLQVFLPLHHQWHHRELPRLDRVRCKIYPRRE